jgi:hypothetical protein
VSALSDPASEPLFLPPQLSLLRSHCYRASVPCPTQVAVELMALASEQGADTWKGSTLNGKTFKLRGFSKLQVGERRCLWWFRDMGVGTPW